MKDPHLSIQFLRAMQDELDANQERKGDWDALKLDRDKAVELLDEHYRKLENEIMGKDSAKIREYAADLANIAMKIDECLGPIRDPQVNDHARMMPLVPPCTRK